MDLNLEQYRVKPGEHIQLAKIDPEGSSGFSGSKNEASDLTDQLTKNLDMLQERLYAAHQNGVLIVLQGMDTSGKDGTIEHVFEGVNPQGVRVASFKAPTPIELEHDFLWRIHQKTPGKGEIVIFNRSQYEDVLVVRVHELVPEKVWSKRYGLINDFERLLVDEGTIILKFFLHISKDEQERRFIDRLDQVEKRWKFNSADLAERKYWDKYMAAYEDALAMTSTEWAPWYIVPANRKWFRNLMIASVLDQALTRLNPQPLNPFSDADIERFKNELVKK
jgi:PPK2 family polyphosphate:nucleotide phosphotransferase